MSDLVAWCILAAMGGAGLAAPVAYYLGWRSEERRMAIELSAHQVAVGQLLIARRCLLEELRQLRAERRP